MKIKPEHDRRHAPTCYFMQFGRRQPVKIGNATHLGVRLRVIASCHHRDLTLLTTLAGGRDVERQIHALLAAHRIGLTEWFRPHAEVLGFARKIASAKLSNELRASIEYFKKIDLDEIFLAENPAD